MTKENVRKTTLREVKLFSGCCGIPNIVSLAEGEGRQAKISLRVRVHEFAGSARNEVGGVGSDATCRYMLQLAQAGRLLPLPQCHP